jgi:hypothetical protein
MSLHASQNLHQAGLMDWMEFLAGPMVGPFVEWETQPSPGQLGLEGSGEKSGGLA